MDGNLDVIENAYGIIDGVVVHWLDGQLTTLFYYVIVHYASKTRCQKYKKSILVNINCLFLQNDNSSE